MRGIPESNESGIYGIFNKNKNCVYIGKARYLRDRAQQHKNKLKNGDHQNKNLQDAYNNGDSLKFVVLAFVDDDVYSDESVTKLTMLESLYMAWARSNGFNLYNIQASDNVYSFALNNAMYYYGVYENAELAFDNAFDISLKEHKRKAKK